jgi:signal transduction histidine kinase/HD-like signal output (HDOD) protein
MDRSDLKNRIDRLRCLPSPPRVAARVLPLALDPAAELDQLGELIGSDPALAVAVLRGAGTRWRGVQTPSIRMAPHELGQHTVRTAVLNVTTETLFGEVQQGSRARMGLWKRALAGALGAETIAVRINHPTPHEAYLAGLLHDIGKAVLLAVAPEAWSRAVERAKTHPISDAEAEQQELGVDHALAGKWFGQRNGFPQRVLDVVWLHHHAPGSLDGTGFPVGLLDIVHAADFMTDCVLEGRSVQDAAAAMPDGLLSRLELPLDQFAAMVPEIAASMKDRVARLTVDVDTPEGRAAPLHEAMSALLSAHERVDSENALLRKRNRLMEATRLLDADLAPCRSQSQILTAAATSLRRNLGAAPGMCCAVDGAGRYLHVRTWKALHDPLQELFVDLKETPAEQNGERNEAVRAIRELGLSGATGGWAGTGLVDVSTRGGLVAVPMLDGSRSLGQILFDAHAAGIDMDEQTVTGLMALGGACGRAVARLHAHDQLLSETEDLASVLRRTDTTQRRRLRDERNTGAALFAEATATSLQASLSVVSSQAQRLLSRTTDPETLEALDTIVQQGRRVNGMLTDLLTFARRPEPAPEPRLVNIILHQLVMTLQDRLERKNIRVTELYAEGIPRALLDRRQMEQAFLKLMVNAEQAMAEAGGTLTIQTGSTPDRKSVIIRFSDTGPGISGELLPQVFDPFVTAEHGGRGVGLGLPICQAIVDGHRGRVDVESVVGGGTTFTIIVPSASEPAATATDLPAEDQPETPDLPTVLVVDDDENVRDILKQSLQMRGYHVRTAEDGMAAMREMGQERIDLLLLDLFMPNKSGLEVMDDLSQRGHVLPVIVMTGSSEREDIEQAMARGARTCLHKPFELRQLLAEVDGAFAK